MNQDLRNLMNHPAAFRDAVLIDVDGEVAPLREVIDDWQLADFQSQDGGWLRMSGRNPLAEGKQRIWSERPRGHSKTTDLAISVTWALFASARRICGVVAAADRDQAQLLRNAIEVLLRVNPWLAEFLDVQQWQVVNKHTNSSMRIISSDAGSSYGLLLDFVVCDELTHWRSRDLFDSLFSAADKRRHCVMVSITNAGFMGEWQWDVREQVRNSDDWHFSSLAGPQASWITAERLERQESLLPGPVFRRLWKNEWTDGTGDALLPSDIRAAVRLPGALEHRDRNYVMYGGLDLSISRDKSAFVVIGVHSDRTEVIRHETPVPSGPQGIATSEAADHSSVEMERVRYPGSGRIRLAHIRTWTPSAGQKIDLRNVEDHVRTMHRKFGLKLVLADPYQAELMIQQLCRDVPIAPMPFSGNALTEMAGTLIEAFASHQIDLYPHKELLDDLYRLRIEERSYGFRLVADRTAAGHCDTATALSLALMAGRRTTPMMKPKKVNRSLLLLTEEELQDEPQWMNDDDPWGDADRPYQWSPGLAEWRRFS